MKTTKHMVQKAFSSRNHQRGASLLEGIAYLGIAAIVILGAVSLLTGAFSSAQSNQAAEELISLRTATKKLYAGQPYTAGANLLTLLNTARAVPGSLVVAVAGGAATATNKWGGNVTVTGGIGGSTFAIAYQNIPQEVCVAIVSGASGWTQISDGTTTLDLGNSTASAAQAGTVCPGATSSLTFTST